MEDTTDRFLVLGGDSRYPAAAESLRKRGYEVEYLDGTEEASPEEALSRADAVLLPLHPFQDGFLRLGDHTIEGALLPDRLKPGCTVVAGTLPEALAQWFHSRGVRCVELLEQESYLLPNAMLTAEGALWLIMDQMNRSVRDAEVMIVGWGRIGRYLANLLDALGASVSVASRKRKHRLEILLRGLKPEVTGQYDQGLDQYDLIVNTVPAPVFSELQMHQIPAETLLLELASSPGGFPESFEGRVEIARGLPGSYAPYTAGEQLAQAVLEGLYGEERTLE